MSTYVRDNREFRAAMRQLVRKQESCQTDKLFCDTFREAQARKDKREQHVKCALASMAIGFVVSLLFYLSIVYR